MSNPLKGIKKAFAKVVKVVKKIALPALAIGAVVLTGGAALGALPSVGSVLGSIGIKGALAGILTTAAKTAAMGAAGSLLTGGNPIKGATAGFLAGGVAGGLGAALGGAGKVAQTAGGMASSASNTAMQGGESPYGPVPEGASFDEAFAPVQAQGLGAGMDPTAMAMGDPAYAPVSNGQSSGIFSLFGANDPTTKGMLIQGLGNGMMAMEQAKAEKKAWQREKNLIEENYGDLGPVFGTPGAAPSPMASAGPAAGDFYRKQIYGLKYDPVTGQISRAAA